MDRFINVKKHDEVYSRKFGDGYFVEYDSTQPDGPYVFCFPKLSDGKGLSIGYYPTGKLDVEDIEPDLFYRNGDERYLEERSETIIPKGTKVRITWINPENNSGRYFQPGEIAEIIGVSKQGSYSAIFENGGKWRIGNPNDEGAYCKFEIIEDPKKEINWHKWEGKEIEVYDSNAEVWKERKLIKYLPEKEYPFICEHGNCSDSYSGWSKARLIKEKELEIDWSKVCHGTSVKTEDPYRRTDIDYVFVTFIPHSEWPFIIRGSLWDENSYIGVKICKLAEPVKPEWLKKD